MLARVEVALRPEWVDAPAEDLLKKVQQLEKWIDATIASKIRWSRLLQVYWIDLEVSREMLIPAMHEIFLDKNLNWIFTGNLIPAAADQTGGLKDLMQQAPVRPGYFWGLEKRLRAKTPDPQARVLLETFEVLLGRPIPQARAYSGKLWLLEGAQLKEEDLEWLATRIFCQEDRETWTLVPESILKKNDRFHQERLKCELAKRSSRRSASCIHTLESWIQKKLQVSKKAPFLWKLMPSQKYQKRAEGLFGCLDEKQGLHVTVQSRAWTDWKEAQAQIQSTLQRAHAEGLTYCAQSIGFLGAWIGNRLTHLHSKGGVPVNDELIDWGEGFAQTGQVLGVPWIQDTVALWPDHYKDFSIFLGASLNWVDLPYYQRSHMPDYLSAGDWIYCLGKPGVVGDLLMHQRMVEVLDYAKHHALEYVVIAYSEDWIQRIEPWIARVGGVRWEPSWIDFDEGCWMLMINRIHEERWLNLLQQRGIVCTRQGQLTNRGLWEVKSSSGELGESVSLERVAQMQAQEDRDLGDLDSEIMLDVSSQGNPSAECRSVSQIWNEVASQGIQRFLTLWQNSSSFSQFLRMQSYDSEVQARGIIKPLQQSLWTQKTGRIMTHDATVLKLKYESLQGVVITSSICLLQSLVSPQEVAASFVDELVRKLLCAGAAYGHAPEELSLVLHRLIPERTNRSDINTALDIGIRQSLQEFGLGVRASWQQKVFHLEDPALWAIGLGHIPELHQARSSDFKSPGDQIYILGIHSWGLLGSQFLQLNLLPMGSQHCLKKTSFNGQLARNLYHWLGRRTGKHQDILKSLRSITSEGLWIALVQSLIVRGLGVELLLPERCFGMDAWELFFGNGVHAVLASVSEAQSFTLESECNLLQIPFLSLGKVLSEPQFKVLRMLPDGSRLRSQLLFEFPLSLCQEEGKV